MIGVEGVNVGMKGNWSTWDLVVLLKYGMGLLKLDLRIDEYDVTNKDNNEIINDIFNIYFEYLLMLI